MDTARSSIERGLVGCAAGVSEFSSLTGALHSLWLRNAAFLLSLICLAPASTAQSWRIEPSIAATATATTNSGLSTAENPPKDIILDIEPRLLLQGKGANFSLDGNVGLHRLTYVKSTQPNRFLPTGTISLNTNLVDRWVYFDASVGAEQVMADPFSLRGENDTGLNKINAVNYRLSPYVRHSFTPSLALSVRSDNIWSRRRGDFTDRDPRRNSRIQKETLLLEQKPLPFGFSVEATQETTSYSSGVQTVLKIGSARAVATYALDPTFIVGLTGGTEKSEYALSSSNDRIVGGRVTWAPTERTELRGNLEKRFFGTGGSLQWSHRSPFLGFYASASREPAAIGASFVLNQTGGDVQSLLDAIFTTRYPNPSDRATIVKSVISGLGIPSVLGEPVEVFSDYAQLRDSASLSIIFQGVRSTLIARVYGVKSRPLNQSNAVIAPTSGLTADNYQKGLSVDFNRRLTPTLSVDAGIGHATIEGLGIVAGQTTTNTAVRIGLIQAVTPKTSFTVGARYQKTDLVAPGQDATAEEIAAFLGVAHRF